MNDGSRGDNLMNIQHAIMAFSQSEKVKSGIIWVSQAVEMLNGVSEPEKQGGERIIEAIMNMLIHEIRLARSLVQDVSWEEVEKSIDQAIVMVNSHVASESVVHLTKALSQVTGIGHRSMAFLKQEELI
jgi:hypothetical protein